MFKTKHLEGSQLIKPELKPSSQLRAAKVNYLSVSVY